MTHNRTEEEMLREHEVGASATHRRFHKHELVAALCVAFGADWAGLTDTERKVISPGFDVSSGHAEAYVHLSYIAERIVTRIIARYRTYENYFARTNGVWLYDVPDAFFDAKCMWGKDDGAAIEYAITKSLIPE